VGRRTAPRFDRRLKKAFDANNVEIPRRLVYISDPRGEDSPFRPASRPRADEPADKNTSTSTD